MLPLGISLVDRGRVQSGLQIVVLHIRRVYVHSFAYMPDFTTLGVEPWGRIFSGISLNCVPVE